MEIADKRGVRLLDLTGPLHHKHLAMAAKAAGASLVCESSGKWCVWQVEAPVGMCWEPGLHALRVEWLAGDTKYRDLAIRDAIDRIEEMVISPCPHDCDH